MKRSEIVEHLEASWEDWDDYPSPEEIAKYSLRYLEEVIDFEWEPEDE